MNLSELIMPWSAKGWEKMQSMNISIPALAWKLVLPLSFLPPVLLYYAGTHYDNSYIQNFPEKNWHFITTTFFLAELLTFFVMGWLIHSVLESHDLAINYHDAYLLAAIAPIPMWLSSLGLLIPSALITSIFAGVGLVASCVILYLGTSALCHRNTDDVVSMSATYTIMSAAFLAWIMLMVIVWAY
ncbi:Yip1 family protein [Thalassolituus alkanivorans]|uniref:Yip1 family protein n=1 Tax=Thalassolituus alkanivorans TaxID=2881055 RepID=UPI001E524216|nr:Yip1 family protein [Thalassolituus alkanivorans]MCB2385918.1 YIP1 family protein [Thalassolituus alkanivorans]MCB2424557.1 YIP1 family protein [Thalassolituus alkanivorans]